MNTSADAPYLDCAYKLEEYEGRPRRKRSEGKSTWPGCKQVYRRFGDDGRLAGDVLTLAAAKQQGAALLLPVMRAGRLLAPTVVLDEVRENARTELTRLPEPLRALDDTDPYFVEIAPQLRDLAAQIDAHT